MEKYRLIATDVDGTLLNGKKKLTAENREAIRRAAEAGKEVVIATGRSILETVTLRRDLPQVRYLICENGSCIVDLKEKKDIYKRCFSQEMVRYLMNFAADKPIVVQVFSNNRCYFLADDDEWLDRCGMASFRADFKRAAIYKKDMFEHYDEAPFPVEKIGFILDNEKDFKTAADALTAYGLRPMHSTAHMMEMVSPGTDKGRALCELSALLDIPIENCIAVGDSENDVPMINAAGLGVSMGNGDEKTIAAADVICPDCEHSGVAWVIENYLLKDSAQK